MKTFDTRARARVFGFAAAAALAATCLAGCGGQAEPENVVIIAGARANCTAPLQKGVEYAESALASNGYFDLIVSDSNPTSALAEGGMLLDANTGSRAQDDQLRSAKKKTVKDALATCRADDEGCDILAAIDYAKKSLSSAPASSKNTIVVLESGWSESGMMDFTKNLIACDPNDIVEAYREELPDLEGVNIEWFVGTTSDNQETPTTSAQKRCLELWQVVLDACGANLSFHECATTTQAYQVDALPAVKSISMPALPEPPSSPTQTVEQVVLPNDVLCFNPGEATFANENEADAILASWAEYFASHPQATVAIVGSCASDRDADYVQRLSEERAEATKNRLSQLGVDQARISTSGTGCTGGDHVYDWIDEATNTLDPIPAAANRHVTLMISE